MRRLIEEEKEEEGDAGGESEPGWGIIQLRGKRGIRNSVRRSAFQLVQASRRLGKPNVEIVDGVIAHELSTHSSFALGRRFALISALRFNSYVG